MSGANNKITVKIDNIDYQVDSGLTILQAAEKNGIYIPTLCAHKELTPYGGCRMCLVEVEGARDFLTACTTPVQNGMIIRTHTDQIQKERREILELILSEHTSSCLVCDERVECKNSMGTIRKVGVTTGCRFCPNDDKCELEEVVNWLGLDEITHPVSYRNLPVERLDPFYDRDYNICILCGRCVRVCQEVRNANVLAFRQRGRQTVIGPAFGRSHLESGCEFCGACVSICPTGTLAERANKWDGVHDREETTTCALCGVGCQMRLLIKGDKVIGTEPAEDDLVNGGQLCVKGRFCVYELVNHYERLKRPVKRVGSNTNLKIGWDEAIDIATERLRACKPQDFGMVVSPNCSNEDLYIAQKFTRVVMGSNHIDTSAREHYGGIFHHYADLLCESVPAAEIEASSVIIAMGLDMQYGRSVIGVKVRKAIQKGAEIITMHPHEHSLSLSADIWFRTSPKDVPGTIRSILSRSKKSRSSKDAPAIRAAGMLSEAKHSVILIGPEYLDTPFANEILKEIRELARKTGAGIIPLPAFNNLYGSLLMGCYYELMPGAAEKDVIEKVWESSLPGSAQAWTCHSGRSLNTLYLMGHVPESAVTNADFVIYQNIYPAQERLSADIILPAAAFTEIDGTFINGEGRVQRVRRGVAPPEDAMPDWKILCTIAKKMGASGFDFKNEVQIRKEIARIVPGFDKVNRETALLPKGVVLKDIKPGKDKATGGKSRERMPVTEHVYRGIPIAEKVDGFKTLIA
jgi:predicted molibdopterin-dependent oxidoreductase YjgC